MCPRDQSDSGEADPDPDSLEELYSELHRLAQAQFGRQSPGHTLQPTVLVHEAWLRLSSGNTKWSSREHFLCLAARVMRHVMVDHARQKGAEKRAAVGRRVTLDERLHPETGGALEALDLLDLDRALEELAALDEERARLVEMRFFGGLSEVEIASALDCSRSDVQRKWRLARAWLGKRLRTRGEG